MTFTPRPGAGTSARPHVRLPADLLAALDARAARERRSRDGEAELALRAYLEAHRDRLPEPGALGTSERRTRLRFDADDLVRLDETAGEARERHLIEAIRRWVQK